MTYFAGATNFQDSNVDAFGRLRVSEMVTQFESKFHYGVEEKSYNTTTATGGTATFLSNEAAWNLATTTSSGSRVLRQSYNYMQYHPGKSQHILMTGVIGSPVANCTKRIGYYDDGDGLFFVQNGTAGFGVAERTSTSGSPVDTIYYQTSWNLDKLDGTGPSGLTLDLTKTQIFIMDFQWLGVGTVRYGVSINGKIIYVHYAHHANILTQVYMKSAWLPLRYEIVNTAATASTASLKQICSTVASEGGMEEKGSNFSASSTTSTTVGTANWVPLIAIQVGSTFNSQQFRGKIILESYSTLVTSNTPCQTALFEASTLTGAVWTAVSSTSAINYDITSTAITGGIMRQSSFNGKTTDLEVYFHNDNLYGYAGDIFVVAAKGIGGNSTVSAAINWREII